MRKRVEQSKNKKKENNKKILVNIVTVLLILLLIILGLLFILNFKKIGIIRSNKLQEIDINSYVDINYSKESEMASGENELIVYDKGKIYAINSNSNITWEYGVNNLIEPKINIASNYIMLVDNYNGSYYIFKNKELISENKINNKIKNSGIDKRGTCFFNYSDKGYKNMIRICNSKNEKYNNIYLMSNIVSNVILKDDFIYYNDIITNNNKIESKINRINIKDSKLKIEEVLKLENETVYNFYFNSYCAIINTSNNIYKFHLKNKEIESMVKLDENVLFADYNKNTLITITKKYDNMKKEVSVKSKNITFNFLNEMVFEEEPYLLEFKNGIATIIDNNFVYLLNSQVQKLKQYKLSSSVSDLEMFNNGNSIAIVIANKIYILNL